MKVSCVMTTYRRFNCVERSMSMFLNQDYQDKELIIFNTDIDYPLSLPSSPNNIKIINNGIDFITGLPYTNVGAIRRDALTFASGDYYYCYDDDDIYLPWYISQGVDGIKRTGRKAWKPIKSFYKHRNGIEPAKNTLEASVIVDIKEVNFRLETGSEGLGWYIPLRDSGQLDENDSNSIPAYAFNWADPIEIGGHKQSGDINNPNCFEDHKKLTVDFAKRPLEIVDVSKEYEPFYQYFRSFPNQFNQEYLSKYVIHHL